MADPYVIFPGTAGNYVSTDDVNLLDADRAHIVQSQPWLASRCTIVDEGIQPDGWGQILLTVTEAASNPRAFSEGFSIPVEAGEYSGSYEVENLTGHEQRFNVSMRHDVANKTGTFVTVPAGETVRVVSTQPGLDAGNLTGLWLSVISDASQEIGDQFKISKVMFAKGADDQFYPSLRIVGDLDMRATVAADSYASGSNQIIIEALDAVNGGGYRMRLDDNLTEFALLTGDGSGLRVTNSSGAGLVVGADVALRATFAVADGEIKFYKDGVAFQTTAAAAGPIGAGILPQLFIGRDSGGGALFAGNFYTAEVRDGIDGPVVARFDAADVPQPAQLPI